MPFIGNTPDVNFTSFAKQDLTGVTGSPVKRGFTLTHAVANANEIEVFVNNVRQEPTEAYTVSGTGLTMTGDVETSDDFYIIYLGKAIQTTVPPDGSVSTTKLADSAVNSAKINYPLTTFSSTGIDDNADATAITIDSSENVGIGTSSPSSLLHINNTADSANGITIQNASSSGSADAYLQFTTANSTVRMGIDATGTDIFKISNGTALGTNDALAIDSSDNVLVGATSNGQFTLSGENGIAYANIGHVNGTASGYGYIIFRYNGTVIGRIDQNGTSGVSYNTSSDHRLKENVDYTFDATTRLKQLKPCRFNFIADADTTVDGFLAHEVQSVVPEAITGTHNEVDDDGNPVMQGIDASKIVPLLVKTIQELEARITALEGN